MKEKPEKSKGATKKEKGSKVKAAAAKPEESLPPSPLDHPLVAPLLFSFFFSLLFALLFSLLLLPEKEEEEPRKNPALIARCFKELQQPFMMERGATRLTCTSDGKDSLIISYGYRTEDVGKGWANPNQETLTLYRGEDGLYCLDNTCLKPQMSKNGLRGQIIKK